MLHDEKLLTLTQAAKLLPHRPHLSSVWRWVRQGVQGVRLEHVKVGRRLFTTEEAVKRFIARLTEVDREAYTNRHPTTSSPISVQKHRNQSFTDAERELEAAGI